MEFLQSRIRRDGLVAWASEATELEMLHLVRGLVQKRKKAPRSSRKLLSVAEPEKKKKTEATIQPKNMLQLTILQLTACV